jgi:triphosphatase
VLAGLRLRFEQLLAHQQPALLGNDPEEVHDMRVATRRIRALLRIFPEALHHDEAALFRGEFGWIGDALGAARDLDVQIGQRSAWEDSVGTTAHLAPLIAVLDRRRSEARAELTKALDSDRYEHLVSTFAVALDGRRSPNPDATAPALEVVPPVLARFWKRVRTSGRELQPDSSSADFHRVRIRAKRLRYATEAATELYGRPATSMIRKLAGIQDVLGAHQDLQVLVADLRDLAVDPSLGFEPATIFAMGELAADRARRARKLRLRFEEPFDRLGPAWKRLYRAMGKAR